jgi:hypothetical protein
VTAIGGEIIDKFPVNFGVFPHIELCYCLGCRDNDSAKNKMQRDFPAAGHNNCVQPTISACAPAVELDISIW